MNSREEKLLIGLIKGTAGKESYENIEWNKFIELCSYNRITFFIYSKLDKKLVPENELNKLKEINKKVVSFNMVLNKEMIPVLEELKRKKIDFVVLKGMALNHLLYKENFSRVSSDIDFLVKEKDNLKVKEIIERRGYKSREKWGKNSCLPHYPLLAKEVNGFLCRFETHTELFFPLNCFSVDPNEILKDSKKIGSVAVLCNEDSIIISVLSAVYQHDFYGTVFEALIDVENLLSKEIDYKKLSEKTVKYNAVEPMVYFNKLMKEFFGEEIKGVKELENNADKRKIRWLEKHLLENIVKKKKPLERDLSKIKSRFFWAKNSVEKLKILMCIFLKPAAFIKGDWKNIGFLDNESRK